MLFWRENVGFPAGILPRAFSDMPRSCTGTASSIEEHTDAALDATRSIGEDRSDCAGVGFCSSSVSSSSSPMANVASSSGTPLRVGWR